MENFFKVRILNKKINELDLMVRDPNKQNIIYKAGDEIQIVSNVKNKIYWQRLQDDGIVTILQDDKTENKINQKTNIKKED